MRTGRPRGFCVEETLDRAMTVFWRHGYEGASMSDLTSAMGINSPSLYACFGSKEGLFRAVLERYEERRKSFMESVLAAPTAAKAAESYLHGVADFAIDTRREMRVQCTVICGFPYASVNTASLPSAVCAHDQLPPIGVATVRSGIVGADWAASGGAVSNASAAKIGILMWVSGRACRLWP